MYMLQPPPGPAVSGTLTAPPRAPPQHQSRARPGPPRTSHSPGSQVRSGQTPDTISAQNFQI